MQRTKSQLGFGGMWRIKEHEAFMLTFTPMASKNAKQTPLENNSIRSGETVSTKDPLGNV